MRVLREISTGANTFMSSQLTMRSILTGLVIGGLLTPCNVYSGLKIGWSFNMSILAALLSYGLWAAFSRVTGAPEWSMQESVYSQTSASAAASIISGGLVAPIPAYTMITGLTLSASILILWVFLVSLLGVLVAVGLRHQMLVTENLVFPVGVATAETVRDIHESSGHGRRKLLALFIASILAFSQKLISEFWMVLPKMPFLPSFNGLLGGLKLSAKKLGLVLDPSLLMVGFGMIMGFRSGLSMLFGALICWLGIVPMIISKGFQDFDANGEYIFGSVVGWTLWPGVGLMVSASITTFLLSVGRSILKKKTAFKKLPENFLWQPRFLGALSVFAVVLAAAQYFIFSISWGTGVLAVLASVLLGVVSSRVTGETGIAPIGALGKVTQLSFGFMNPGQIATNLMTANVTGGAAGQSSDLLHDLKAGLLLQVNHYHQVIAQCFGIAMGALVGTMVYLFLIPDPAKQLLTDEWPAPAVATWKSVADLVAKGSEAFPLGAQEALWISLILGITMALVEGWMPKKMRLFWPSASAMGLAFIIPAWTSLTLFVGSLLALVIHRLHSRFAKMFVLVIAAGLVTGESLAGVVSVVLKALWH
ncbi:MAG: OPT/YSL family transporter [Pseudobdellovibrionaceae bacterium]|nr:MAG: OPT/YSL family transporter [Pseudobdellovibrionaceae bacterium]